MGVRGRGEQVRRYLGTTSTYTLYDEAGHWLGDYDTDGALKQQAIWLDHLAVGLLAHGGQLHYIEPDHLGSPHVVVDAAHDVAVWNWSLKGEAFGNMAPNQDPDGDGTAMVFDTQFPGQRFDAASGLNQNYFRNYDAATGRYGQSDPIGPNGPNGGISTYAYVRGNPFRRIVGSIGRSSWATIEAMSPSGNCSKMCGSYRLGGILTVEDDACQGRPGQRDPCSLTMRSSWSSFAVRLGSGVKCR